MTLASKKLLLPAAVARARRRGDRIKGCLLHRMSLVVARPCRLGRCRKSAAIWGTPLVTPTSWERRHVKRARHERQNFGAARRGLSQPKSGSKTSFAKYSPAVVGVVSIPRQSRGL